MLNELSQDVRHASRALLRSPGFTVTASLIVALGIGANATVFTVVNAVLFKPPPYDDPERVVAVYQNSDAGDPSSSSFPATRDMATYTDVFSGVAAMSSATITWKRRTDHARLWSNSSPPATFRCSGSNRASDDGSKRPSTTWVRATSRS